MSADNTHSSKEDKLQFPISVPNYRFDQRNEMFKRRTWDKEIIPHAKRFYNEVEYRDRYGYRKLDYALRTAAWNIEYGFGFGTMRSNYGLYSWTEIAAKVRPFVETGGPVVHAPEVNSRIVKKAAQFLGADGVGICRVHPNLVYSHEYNLMTMEHTPLELPEGCQNAIVMAVAMDYDSARHSPDAISGASTGLGYSRQAVLANQVAAFIRVLGYRAVPSGNDTALSVPLALAAGLGEVGRMGLLITEKFGPLVRICKVFTDLPLAYDTYRPFGVTKFCETCKKCAIHCPSQAIPYGGKTIEGPSFSNHSGIFKWYIHPKKCFIFWAKNRMDCNNCIKVCPFNKPRGIIHDMARFVIKNLSPFNRVLVLLDDLFGYGKPLRSKDFWEKR